MVTINVVDPFGRELPYRVASFVDRHSGADVSSRFAGLEGSNIPMGVYLYRLERSGIPAGAGSLSGEITVFRPNVRKTVVGRGQYVLVEGQPASIDIERPKDFLIEGIVRRVLRGAKPTWIRFQSVYQNYSIEVSVDEFGHFRIYEPLDGTYLAIIISGDSLLGTQPVSFEQGVSSAKFEIALSDHPPATISVRGSTRNR
jgi:hypothetical protein